ncbi:glucose/arabinose dehydrogenase [Bradyrhizobium sp. GM5.1]
MRSRPASTIPRWIEVLPNGDVLIAEATQIAGAPRSVFHYAMQATMRRAAALGVSANRITLLRDKDGDGVAEYRGAFMENLSQPFGMALVGDTFYVGNTDGVMAFPYVANADRITAPGKRLTTFKPSGHWTRSLLASPDGKKLYAGVGSLSNIGEMGMEVEEGRAAVYELDLVAGTHPHLRRRPAQPGWSRLGADDRCALDRRQRARRPRRRNAAGLSDLGARRRFLRLALLLLGQDGG